MSDLPRVILGQTRCSMINPPNDGMVKDGDVYWDILHNGEGKIALRRDGLCHVEFLEGKYMLEFVEWINSQ